LINFNLKYLTGIDPVVVSGSLSPLDVAHRGVAVRDAVVTRAASVNGSTLAEL
jgi:hypothetical protein